jgi:hypothetical protein
MELGGPGRIAIGRRTDRNMKAGGIAARFLSTLIVRVARVDQRCDRDLGR